MGTLGTVKGRLRSAQNTVLRDVEPVWRAANAGATRAHRRDPRRLTDEGRRVVADLDRDGVARSSLSALTGDPTLLGRLQELAAGLEERKSVEVERRRAALQAGQGAAHEKVFVLELLDPARPVIEPDGLLARVALDPDIKGIADAYYGMRTRVADLNIWRTLPSSGPAKQSQMWHRDVLEDHLILKVFVYLEDATEGSGPFSYVTGTHGKGARRMAAPSMHDGLAYRVGDEQMAQLARSTSTFLGDAGMVLFADTIGYHKGGYARTEPRLVMQTLYGSPSSDPKRRLGVPAGLPREQWPAELAYDPRTAR